MDDITEVNLTMQLLSRSRGVWGKKPGVQALAWDAASRRLPAREFTKRVVFYLTDAKLKTSDVVIQWISSHLARASAETADRQKSLT